MKKIKLTEESIVGMPDLVKEIALDWYRNISRGNRNYLMDKYEIESPLSNGCVLKIYQAEN